MVASIFLLPIGMFGPVQENRKSLITRVLDLLPYGFAGISIGNIGDVRLLDLECYLGLV